MEQIKFVSFSFAVVLSNGMKIVPEMKEQILDWYYTYGGSNAESSDMLESEFKFVKSNIIECSYKIKKEIFEQYVQSGNLKSEHSSIANPDRSGNYPIEIGDITVKIYGNLKDSLVSVQTESIL
jgi:hypothetical protein